MSYETQYKKKNQELLWFKGKMSLCMELELSSYAF